jgi:hypothetical protein
LDRPNYHRTGIVQFEFVGCQISKHHAFAYALIVERSGNLVGACTAPNRRLDDVIETVTHTVRLL